MSSPSELFSCVPAVNILRSPLNRSSAKNHWSFSKSPRFTTNRLNCQSIYNIPETKSKRKTSFGYGKKIDLDIGKNPHQITPPPNTYSIPTFVDINKLHAKGFTPRYSRQPKQIAPMSYIQLQPAKMPAPGRYEEYRYRDTPFWSMRPKVSSELFPVTTQKIVPGPGAHQQVDNIHPTGKYQSSKKRNSKSKVFNPTSSCRFAGSSTPVPGPGNYQQQNNLSGSGFYVLSTNPSAGKRKILLGQRDSFVDQVPKRSKTPGPGTYRVPSDFGHYDQVKTPTGDFKTTKTAITRGTTPYS